MVNAPTASTIMSAIVSWSAARPTSIVPSSSMNFCMLRPRSPSSEYSYISHRPPIARAKQKANSSVNAGLNLTLTFCELFMMSRRENPRTPSMAPLKVCRMVSQQGMMKKKLRTSPR